MKHIQTLPIDNSSKFIALADTIDREFCRYGFRKMMYKGSCSWTGGKHDATRSTETFFKLLHRGEHRPPMFGGRLDFYSTISKLASIVWPEVFSVMPSVNVHFGGFEVDADNPALVIQRLKKILGCLPEPLPEQSLCDDTTGKLDLDSQLAAL